MATSLMKSQRWGLLEGQLYFHVTEGASKSEKRAGAIDSSAVNEIFNYAIEWSKNANHPQSVASSLCFIVK